MRINGVNYHVEVTGTGKPLVLLHGFTGSSQSWTELANALKDQFKIITVDLLGHGQTDVPDDPQRYAMPHAAADLIAICESLAIKRFNLLGYSMGGRLALYVAAHYPHRVKRLILESASPGLLTTMEREQRQQSDDHLAQQIEEKGIEWFVDFWENIPLFASQKNLSHELQARQRAQRLSNSPVGLANSLRGIGTGVQPSLWHDLDKLTMPVLLLTGALDTKFTALSDQMAAKIANVQVIKVEDAGHTVHLEKPDICISHISTFLSAH